MFSMTPMFGMVDPKTIQDTLMSNEEYLEKVIEKLPYIGEDYKKEKERARKLEENEEEDQSDSASNEEAEQVEVDVNNESYYEKIKKGISSYWTSWFGPATKPPEKVFPEEEHHAIVHMNSPINEAKEKAVIV